MADLVRASGFVIFRNVTRIEYLLLQASNGIHHWTPPKGHVEANEDLLETAFRETEEEAGINKESLKLYDHSETIYYNVNGKKKAVTYYLAELSPETEIKLSFEHQDFKWAAYQEAYDLVNFEEMQKILKNFNEYLIKNLKT